MPNKDCPNIPKALWLSIKYPEALKELEIAAAAVVKKYTEVGAEEVSAAKVHFNTGLDYNYGPGQAPTPSH
jgi:hypothetical protein